MSRRSVRLPGEDLDEDVGQDKIDEYLAVLAAGVAALELVDESWASREDPAIYRPVLLLGFAMYRDFMAIETLLRRFQPMPAYRLTRPMLEACMQLCYLASLGANDRKDRLAGVIGESIKNESEFVSRMQQLEAWSDSEVESVETHLTKKQASFEGMCSRNDFEPKGLPNMKQLLELHGDPGEKVLWWDSSGDGHGLSHRGFPQLNRTGTDTDDGLILRLRGGTFADVDRVAVPAISLAYRCELAILTILGEDRSPMLDALEPHVDRIGHG